MAPSLEGLTRRALVAALAAAIAAGAACRRPSAGGAAPAHVRIAVGGQTQLVYLPTTLARELGFYRDEGLDVDIQDLAGGSKALEALLGGSADVVSGFYDHTIQMAAEGRELVAFVSMLRYPGMVLATAPDRTAVSRIEDLKGRVAGVTTAGSSSQMLLTQLLLQHGLTPEQVSVTAIGTAATAVAAVERGKVDAGMMTEPAFTQLVRRHPGVRVLADLRHAEGVRAALGTDTYPASVLYASRPWIAAHRDTTARLARAIRRTLEWMHAQTPEEIARRAPAAFRGDDQTLYVDALRSSMAMYSADGVMAREGADAVRRLVAASMPKVRAANVDASTTFTNEFVQAAEPR